MNTISYQNLLNFSFTEKSLEGDCMKSDFGNKGGIARLRRLVNGVDRSLEQIGRWTMVRAIAAAQGLRWDQRHVTRTILHTNYNFRALPFTWLINRTLAFSLCRREGQALDVLRDWPRALLRWTFTKFCFRTFDFVACFFWGRQGWFSENNSSLWLRVMGVCLNALDLQEITGAELLV